MTGERDGRMDMLKSIPSRGSGFTFLHNIRTTSGVHVTSYSSETGDFFERDKETGK
jgi:hypothetical protein